MARDRNFDDGYEADELGNPPPPVGPPGPLDSMFANTNIVVLILFGCCCGAIAFILSLIAYLTGKNPKAKSNAMIVLIISGVMMVVGILAQVLGGIAEQLGGGR